MPRLFLLIACLLLGSGNLIFAQDAKILVAKLRERLSSIQSLDVACDLHIEIVRHGSIEVSEQKDRWVKYYEKERYSLQAEKYKMEWAYNGLRRIQPDFDGAGEKTISANITDSLLPGDFCYYQEILGLKSHLSEKSLADLLSHSSVKKIADIEIGENRYPTLSATEPRNDGALITTVSFDPAHDYAPIRVHYQIPDAKNIPDKSNYPNDAFEVLEWEMVQELFLPVRFKVNTPGGNVLATAKVNSFRQKLPAELFEIRLPDGILVREQVKHGRTKTYITGGVEGATNILEKIKENVDKELVKAREAGVIFDASPQGPSYLWLWIIASVSICLAICFICWRFKRSN